MSKIMIRTDAAAKLLGFSVGEDNSYLKYSTEDKKYVEWTNDSTHWDFIEAALPVKTTIRSNSKLEIVFSTYFRRNYDFIFKFASAHKRPPLTELYNQLARFTLEMQFLTNLNISIAKYQRHFPGLMFDFPDVFQRHTAMTMSEGLSRLIQRDPSVSMSNSRWNLTPYNMSVADTNVLLRNEEKYLNIDKAAKDKQTERNLKYINATWDEPRARTPTPEPRARTPTPEPRERTPTPEPGELPSGEDPHGSGGHGAHQQPHGSGGHGGGEGGGGEHTNKRKNSGAPGANEPVKKLKLNIFARQFSNAGVVYG